MATGTGTPSVSTTALNALDNTQKSEIVRGTIALSAASDTYATGGLVVSFATIAELIKSGLPPSKVLAWSQPTAAAPNTTQYEYQFNPGTTQANGKLQIFVQDGVSTNPLLEYGNGTALTGPFADVIAFEAWFPRFQ